MIILKSKFITSAECVDLLGWMSKFDTRIYALAPPRFENWEQVSKEDLLNGIKHLKDVTHHMPTFQSTFGFDDEDSAMQFKLTWGGE